MSQSQTPLAIIGNNSLVTVRGIAQVPAKTDTGATSSSIWASDLVVQQNGDLEFALFGPGSPFYTGERIHIAHSQVRVRIVRNSTGDVFIRYQVPLSTVIGGRKVRIRYTLADRSRNHFPILIGRSTLKGRFLVDCRQVTIHPPAPQSQEGELNALFARDPVKFHQSYMSKSRQPAPDPKSY